MKTLCALVTLVGVVTAPAAQLTACQRCGWRPPAGRTIQVKNVLELERAAASIRSGETLLLEDGDYPLARTLTLATQGVTVRGRRGDAAKVVIRGRGMTGDSVGIAVSIEAARITLADITIRDVRYHAVQVHGEMGATYATLHNVRLIDAGQQLLKVSVSPAHVYADDGLIACSDLSYTTHAPSDYTNGVDILGAKGWVVRDNRLSRIRGPESKGWTSGPAILAWSAAEATVVERNLIVDSSRGIALGLLDRAGEFARSGDRTFDHVGGVIRNNVIVNTHPWADEAIEVNGARDVRVEHNTVFVDGRTPWSIGVRFPNASARVTNNLTNRAVFLRDSGRATSAGNIFAAKPSWFVDLAGLDLHLTEAAATAIDAGIPIDDVLQDFDRRPRVSGRGPDAGAFELIRSVVRSAARVVGREGLSRELP